MARECDVSLVSLDTKLNHAIITINKCEKLLSGNGDPEKGVIVQLDRVKQTQETQKKFTWAFLGAIVLPYVYEIIKRVL